MPAEMTIMQEVPADHGFAVKRDGLLLLRTASDTPHQAMGNGLCLVFGCDPYKIDWQDPAWIKAAWEFEAELSAFVLEIVPCRAVEVVATPIGENAPPTSANAQGTGGIAEQAGG